MTLHQQKLVEELRLRLYDANYPPIYVTDNETLEAVETAILESLGELGLPRILKCGLNGLYFKGCELVVKNESKTNREAGKASK